MKAFAQVVASIEALPEETQEALVDLIRRRLAERRREALARAVQQARQEFKRGKLRPATPSAIMRKVLG